MKNIALAAGTLLLGLFSAQAEIVPIVLTGWNQDVIAENNAGSTPLLETTAATPFGWSFFAQGAPNSSGLTGLPVNGTIQSAFNSAVTFQLQPFTGNNVILNSGTLTLSTPGRYAALSFLSTGTVHTDSAVLNFSDGTSTTLSASVPDWTQNGNVAFHGTGLLVTRGSSWSGFWTGGLSLFEDDFTLSAVDQAKTLDSISINSTSVLMAVSGTNLSTATPEPSTFLLLGTVLTGLGIIRRRKSA